MFFHVCAMAQSHVTIPILTGGNIASSWAVLQCIGQDGYMDIAKRLMEVASRMKEGIQSIEVRHSAAAMESLVIHCLNRGCMCVELLT